MSTPQMMAPKGRKLNIEVDGKPVDADALPDTAPVAAAAADADDGADDPKRKKRSKLERYRDALAQAKDFGVALALQEREDYKAVCAAIESAEKLIADGYTPPKGTKRAKKTAAGKLVWLKPEIAKMIAETSGEKWLSQLEVAKVNDDGQFMFLKVPGENGAPQMFRKRDVAIRNPHKDKSE